MKYKFDVDALAQKVVRKLYIPDSEEETMEAIKASYGFENKIELVVAASIVQIDDLVRANAGLDIEQTLSKAGLPADDKDLMLVSFKLAHVGVNLNRDEFLDTEMRAAIDTPIFKLVNWQHWEPNIGCMFNSRYVNAIEKEAAHLHVDSAISKMKYPAFADDILLRWEENRLYASMETWFEKARCSVCGNEYEDQLDYCSHLRGRFKASSVCSRQLIGLTFAGAGMAVDYPADIEAVPTDVE